MVEYKVPDKELKDILSHSEYKRRWFFNYTVEKHSWGYQIREEASWLGKVVCILVYIPITIWAVLKAIVNTTVEGSHDMWREAHWMQHYNVSAEKVEKYF